MSESAVSNVTASQEGQDTSSSAATTASSSGTTAPSGQSSDAPSTSAPTPESSADSKQSTDDKQAADNKQSADGKQSADSKDSKEVKPQGDVRQEVHVNINEYVGEGQLRTLEFSPDKECEEVTRTMEIERSSSFVYDPKFMDETVAVLHRQRIVLLLGENFSGKESMARYLANRLRENGEITGNTLVYAPQERHVSMLLGAVVEKQESLHDRVIIFRDAWEKGNRSLTTFLSNLCGDTAQDTTRSFKTAGSYVILTAAPDTLAADSLRTLPEWLRRSIPDPNQDVLRQEIEKRIARFLKDHPEFPQKTLSADTKTEIAKRARTIARVVRFIDVRLSAFLLGTTSIKQAFDELDLLSSWFRSDYEHSESDTSKAVLQREAWIYCLALVIAHAANNDGVPWSEFATVYEAVRRQVIRWHKIRTCERPYDDTRLQEIARASTVRDVIYSQDVIRFDDAGSAERLWSILLTKFRPLAIALVPGLQKLTGNRNPAIRARAAQALGRIGSLDAYGLSGRWMRFWAAQEDWKDRSLAGYLTQGAMNSGDRHYRRFVLAVLDEFAKEHAWTAIAAYKQLGAVDLTLCLDKLKNIAKAILEPVFEKTRENALRLAQADRDLEKEKTAEARAKVARLAVLADYYNSLFQQEKEEIAQTFKYTLVSLALTEGVSRVLAQLTRWTHAGRGISALVCLVFLLREGIAHELTRRKVVRIKTESDEEGVSCSVILDSLIDDTEAIRVLASFLEAVYAGLLDFFSPEVAHDLAHMITDYLREWVRESLSSPPCRKAMVELIGLLLGSNLAELGERIYDWLSSEPSFATVEMAAFAKDARKFRPQLRESKY